MRKKYNISSHMAMHGRMNGQYCTSVSGQPQTRQLSYKDSTASNQPVYGTPIPRLKVHRAKRHHISEHVGCLYMQ